MARPRGFRHGRSTPRRHSAWALGPSTGGTPPSTQPITAPGTTLGTVGVTPTVEGLTIARLRGQLFLAIQAATSAGDGLDGAFGIAIADSEAFTAGAASLPDPQDEPDAEVWLFHQWFHIESLQTTQSAVGDAGRADLIMNVDSKAMRKFPGGKTLYCILGVTEVGAVTVDWNFASRLLVLLS